MKPPPVVVTLRVVTVLAGSLLFGVSALVSLLFLGLSGMCTDDFDDSDCTAWQLQALIPVGIGAAVLVLALGTLVTRRTAVVKSLAAIVGVITALGVIALGLLFTS